MKTDEPRTARRPEVGPGGRVALLLLPLTLLISCGVAEPPRAAPTVASSSSESSGTPPVSKPSGTFEVLGSAGTLRAKPGDEIDFRVRLSLDAASRPPGSVAVIIKKGKVGVDSARMKPVPPGPGSYGDYEVKIKAPKEPGRYMIGAEAALWPRGDQGNGDATVLDSKPVELVVEAAK